MKELVWWEPLPPPTQPARLTEGQKAIRDFLRMRNCYDVLPLSFRLIELDIGLTVKESLNILVQCGMSHTHNDSSWEEY